MEAHSDDLAAKASDQIVVSKVGMSVQFDRRLSNRLALKIVPARKVIYLIQIVPRGLLAQLVCAPVPVVDDAGSLAPHLRVVTRQLGDASNHRLSFLFRHVCVE